jgi:Flp pilus assembly protein TadG
MRAHKTHTRHLMRARHRRQKGAAMAEMCIVLPLLILMWFGIDYFRSGYARRLQAIAESHQKAWALAYSNDGSCYSASGNESSPGNSGQNDPYDAGNTGTKGSQAATAFSQNSSSSMFRYGHANVQTNWKTRAARFQEGAVGNLPAGTYVACDEIVPQKSDDQNVFGPLLSFIGGIL